MTNLFKILTIICITFLPLLAQQNIELTINNPQSIIGTKSTNFSIFGIQLGMKEDEAIRVLNSKSFLEVRRDKFNSTQIYVYDKYNKCILNLVWTPNIKYLTKIVFFQDSRKYLSDNFKKLLTYEVIDNNSNFKKSFIGYHNKSKVTLDIPLIDLKHITYFYEDIGLEIIKKHSKNEDEIVFSLE